MLFRVRLDSYGAVGGKNIFVKQQAYSPKQCRTQSMFGDTVYSCYCKFRLVTPMMGAEGTKMFYFDNPRSLEKALSGTELHRKSLLLTKKY